MIYLDTNIFINARINRDEVGEICRKVMDMVTEKKIMASTSLLTIDELVWVIKREVGYKEGIEYSKDIINSGFYMLPVNIEDITKALSFMESGLRPRDSIHAATCLNHNIFSILTTDNDFKKVRELEVFSPREFLENYGYK